MSENIQIDGEFFIIKCPHCSDYIQIHRNDINCRIFIHGVYKQTMQQVNPHLHRQSCDQLIRAGHIYGCGNQFTFSPDIGLKQVGNQHI